MKRPENAFSLASRIISYFEGCNLAPYRCPAGVWSIGFGSTVGPSGRRVGPKTPPIALEEAHKLMMSRIGSLYCVLREKVTVPLSPSEWAAVLSLAYNIGLSAFERSTLLVMLNKNDLQSAANEFLRWDKAHTPAGSLVVMPGLQKRRQSERAVFLGYHFEP